MTPRCRVGSLLTAVETSEELIDCAATENLKQWAESSQTYLKGLKLPIAEASKQTAAGWRQEDFQFPNIGHLVSKLVLVRNHSLLKAFQSQTVESSVNLLVSG